MIIAQRNLPNTLQSIPQSFLSSVFKWIGENPDPSDGEQLIQERDFFANVHTAETTLRDGALFESHHEYIDIHYCLSGGEIIEWAPEETLTIKTEFDATKDVVFLNNPKQATSCLMSPNYFAIFFPGEAHMPKVSDGTNKQVKKIVFKIRTAFFV